MYPNHASPIVASNNLVTKDLYCRKEGEKSTKQDSKYVEHLQQITHCSPQYQKIDVLVMEVLQQITNPIPITCKFLVISKTHLSLT